MTADQNSARVRKYVSVVQPPTRTERIASVLTVVYARLVQGVLCAAACCGQPANMLAAVMDAARPPRQQERGSRSTVTSAPAPASRPTPPAGTAITVVDAASVRRRALLGSRNAGIAVDLEEFLFTIYNHNVSVWSKW